MNPDWPADLAWPEAAEAVKQGFLHAYSSYERFASPYDEILPVSNTSINNFNGWGVTIYDSLDTMLLMGLTEEFDRGLRYISQASFQMPLGKYGSFFETVIRYLGGLLSAYAMSERPLLKEKADLLGSMLAPAFNNESGLPNNDINTLTGTPPRPRYGVSLAEIASCQLEYTYLAKITGKKEYYDLADGVMKALEKADVSSLGGMLPEGWALTTGAPMGSNLHLGGGADSGHEYLLKQYLLGARTDRAALELYLRTTAHIITRMTFLSPNRKFLYASSTSGTPPQDRPAHNIEHLACFLPGLFALGAQTLPLDDPVALGIEPETLGAEYATVAAHGVARMHRWVAEGLAETCAVLYADQPSGLGPESVSVTHDAEPRRWLDALDAWDGIGAPPGVGPLAPVRTGERDYMMRRADYLLRPETLESIFLVWRMTHDERWRRYGWDIFRALEREARTPAGYGTVYSVALSPAAVQDSMPSYFLAETLKYLYLLFSEDDLVPLDKWVFNTEAHPLPVISWTDDEKQRFGIP
ncbi:mannosidase [Gloeopeniophorella convolvens]|nr:mannosidase [Gloeopeniophorella convolvens]